MDAHELLIELKKLPILDMIDELKHLAARTDYPLDRPVWFRISSIHSMMVRHTPRSSKTKSCPSITDTLQRSFPGLSRRTMPQSQIQ
jgi:hypothetical protein